MARMKDCNLAFVSFKTINIITTASAHVACKQLLLSRSVLTLHIILSDCWPLEFHVFMHCIDNFQCCVCHNLSGFNKPSLKTAESFGSCFLNCRSPSPTSLGSGIMWFLATSDRGSNEVMNRKLMMCLTEKLDRAIFVDNDCWEHACQLCVLGSLKLVDQMLVLQRGQDTDQKRHWKYYSSIATVCNVCRDLARDLFDTWKALHGSESAMESARKLFPRCCAGRWLSISTSEDRIIKVGEDKFPGVLLAAIKKKKQKENDIGGKEHADQPDDDAGNNSKGKRRGRPKKDSAEKSQDVGHVDLLAVEQTKHYTETMGKWRRHAVETVSDKLWHRTVAVLNKVKGPLTHFSCFLKKTVKTEDLAQHGNTLHQLVCGRAESFLQEFRDLMCPLAQVSHGPF